MKPLHSTHDMRQSWEDHFLEDEETKQALAMTLSAKRDEYHFLQSSYNALSPYHTNNLTDFSEIGLTLCLYAKSIEREGDLLRREVMRLYTALAEHSGVKKPNLDYQAKYRKATEEICIVDVVTFLVGEFNPKQNIRCPFHNERSPSLHVYERTNSYYCFGCCRGGSPLDFIMSYKDLTFKETVEFVWNYL